MSEAPRLTGIGDTIAAIPTIVGYQPAEGCVAVMGASNDVVAVTGVIQWPDEPDLRATAEDLAAAFRASMINGGVDHLMIVGYGETGAARAVAFADAIDATMGNPPTHYEILVQDGRYRLNHPAASWRAVPEPPAEFAVAGWAPAAATREELWARYDPLERPTIEALSADHRRRLDRLSPSLRADIARRSLDRIATRDDRVSDGAQVAHLVQDPPVRDAVIVHAQGDVARTEALVQTFRGAPRAQRAVLAAAAGTALYLRGEAAHADPVLAHAGDDTLAGLARSAVAAGLPPGRVRADLVGAVDEDLAQADARWSLQTQGLDVPRGNRVEEPQHEPPTVAPPAPGVSGPSI